MSYKENGTYEQEGKQWKIFKSIKQIQGAVKN